MSERRASYLCRGDKKNTLIAFFAFLAIGVLGFLFAGLGITSAIVGQGIAFIALIVAAYIFIRYIGTLYRYDIFTEEAGDFLLIVRVQGKKDFTQKKLPLSALLAVIEVKGKSGVEPEKPDLPVVNFSSHLMADDYTLLHFGGDEPELLRINADEEFLSLLATYLPKAENVSDEKEETFDE